VLALSVTTHLFPRLEAESFGAGRLTKIRAQAVSGRSCRRVAEALGVPDRMRAIAPEDLGRNVESLLGTERVLASVIEAVIGAIYLHFGYDKTAAAVVEAFAGEVQQALEFSVDFKSELQEQLAQHGNEVVYEVEEELGPPHDRRFTVAARVEGETIGRGAGRSKKDAEQNAAAEALEER
jgi:ribonuclease III